MSDRTDGFDPGNLGGSSSFYGIPPAEVLAIEQFIRQVTVPIFEGENPETVFCTGTLFTIADRHFIVTAAHILEGMEDPAVLACPIRPERGEIFSLGKITVARPQKPHIDVAVVELLSHDTIDRMRSGWQFLTLSNIRAPYDRGVFVLSGFPTELGTHDDDRLRAPLATIYSERMQEIPPEAELPVDPTLDLFFHYDREGVSLGNQLFLSPHLGGTSGGSVWEYYGVRRAVWSPAAAVKVVGIQSGYLRQRYFRAKNWGAVAEVLKRFDSQLGDAVRTQLNY